MWIPEVRFHANVIYIASINKRILHVCFFVSNRVGIDLITQVKLKFTLQGSTILFKEFLEIEPKIELCSYLFYLPY